MNGPFLFVAVVAAGTISLGATAGEEDAGRSEAGSVSDGRPLFLTGCSSCHGEDGRGVALEGEERGPSLRGVGAAAAYYQLSTGRMPLAGTGVQARRKRPAYDGGEIADLVAYVASLGPGPRLPDLEGAEGDLAGGGVIFRGNCAPCHSASGAGGALSYGRAAPSLAHAEPLEVAAAIRSGPGQMPVFGPNVLSDAEVAGVAEYVQYLRDPDDRGGLPIGRLGPVPEGFVAWFFGVCAFIGCLWWIGARSPARGRTGGESHHG